MLLALSLAKLFCVYQILSEEVQTEGGEACEREFMSLAQDPVLICLLHEPN